MDTATRHDWQAGVVKFFRRATGEKRNGELIKRHYKTKEGYGFVIVNGEELYFNAFNHCRLTSNGEENNLKIAVGEQSRVFADLRSREKIIVLATGLGKEGKLQVTKWCFTSQLLAQEKFCASQLMWRIVSATWCGSKELTEKAEELWVGNNIQELVKWVEKNRSQLLTYQEAFGTRGWHYQFHLERRLPDTEKWEEPELDDFPIQLRDIYGENGFGTKARYRHAV